MTAVLSGQVSTQVRTSTGGNSTVVALPATVYDIPATLWLAADFGSANIRVAVFNNTDGWRVYDPYIVVDGQAPIELTLQTGDSKLSLGRDSGAALVGWTVVANV